MSTWTIKGTGDLLTLDDTLPIGQHRAELASDVAGRRQPTHTTISAGLGCWRITGQHYRLDVIGNPAWALKVAAHGGWREVPK